MLIPPLLYPSRCRPRDHRSVGHWAVVGGAELGRGGTVNGERNFFHDILRFSMTNGPALPFQSTPSQQLPFRPVRSRSRPHPPRTRLVPRRRLCQSVATALPIDDARSHDKISTIEDRRPERRPLPRPPRHPRPPSACAPHLAREGNERARFQRRDHRVCLPKHATGSDKR